jgi:hypothetical protein
VRRNPVLPAQIQARTFPRQSRAHRTAGGEPGHLASIVFGVLYFSVHGGNLIVVGREF